MNLAVTIATYRRKDGKTPFYLKRCLDSVFAQVHTDFKVFLVGDFYDDKNEWETLIASYLSDKLYVINLDEPGERNKYKDDKVALWSCGGTKAFCFGMDRALEQGFDYICHLDHDDYWEKDHLKLINRCIEETSADWICTKSVYGGSILPTKDSKELLTPFLPVPGGVINSATCYNYRTIPLRGEDTNITCGAAIPGDADLWDRMSKYMLENNLKGYLINKVTCNHTEEGYNLK